MHPAVPSVHTSRRAARRLALAAAAAALLLAACGGSDAGHSATPGTDSAPALTSHTPTATDAPTTGEPETDVDPDVDAPGVTDAPGTTAAPDELDADAPDLGRVVALAEEPILADLLTLGITPIASSATVEDVGFQGIPGYDLSDIEVLPMTTLSIEYLATLQPDTIITFAFWVDRVGAAALEGMGDLIVVPDGLTGVDRIATLGELVGRPEHAAAAAEAHAEALAAAEERIIDDCVVSLAAIYSGPSVAAFVDGIWEIPASIEAMGCTLDPGVEDAEADQNGRAWLSLEQLGLLRSDWLILMQTESVPGEADSVAEIEASPLWPTLPAVAADQVVVYDRLGYPGIEGQIRFFDEFSTRFAG